ncbi:MAG: WD40 repeat domain-containing protein [Sulfurovum sp.]|nr:WD40 repeat domain-containing protein [Sulfurovaceae bacterium]
MLTTQLTQNDIKTLAYTRGKLNAISQALNYQSSDPFIVAAFGGKYAKNASLKILDKSLLIKNKPNIELNEIYFSSYFDYKQAGYSKMYSNENVKLGSKKISGLFNDTNYIAFDSLGENITTGSMGSKIKYVNLKTKKVLNSLEISSVNAVEISPDDKFGAVAAYHTIVVWDLKTKNSTKLLKGHQSVIGAVAISPDSKYILSGEFDDRLIYWNIKTGKIVKILKGGKRNWITSISFSPDGNFALVGGNLGDLRYWDLKKGKIIKSIKAKKGLISPDGEYVLSAYNNELKYWNIESGKTIHRFSNHNGALIFSSDGKYALSASKNIIRCLELKRGKILFTLKGHTGFITDLKFSGNNIISVSVDGTIRYWDIGLAMLNATY